MVSQEHHGFLAIAVDDIHHLFGQPAYLDLLEFNKIAEFFRRYTEAGIMISLIHDVFRTELITGPFLELLQNIGADTGTVAKPLHVFLSFFIIKG